MGEVTTRSNQVVEAVRDILVAHLAEKINTGGMRADHYHLQSGAAIMRASLCPAICLNDQGAVTVEESIRGKTAGGTLLPGYTLDDYTIDLEVWLTGGRGEDMRSKFNVWRDGIKACLQDNWSDFEGALQITVGSSDPEFNTGIDSGTLWVGVVNVVAQAYSLQGATTILNS